MVSNPDKGQDSRLSAIASICCAPIPLLRSSTKPKAQRIRDLGLCTAEGDRGKENAVTPGTEKPQCTEQETTSPQRQCLEILRRAWIAQKARQDSTNCTGSQKKDEPRRLDRLESCLFYNYDRTMSTVQKQHKCYVWPFWIILL